MSFNSGLQRVRRTTLGRRTQPGIVGNVRRLRWVGVAAADPRRRKEPLHALDVTSRCAIPLVHVTATNPLRAGRHPDLVTHAIVTDHGTGGVRAVRDVVARERRIVAAGIAAAVMDGVVPVVIVIGIHSVPATIVRLERVMRPANAGIGASDNNTLSGETQCPHLGRVRVCDPWFDRGRLRRRFFDTARLRQVVVDKRIAFHSRHV